MKWDTTEFVSTCPNCQQVKPEHLNPSGLIQEIGVPTWKWKEINMHFIIGLPRTRSQNVSILVIVDRLTKSAHFIPVKSTYMKEDYARININEIVSLHGIPLSIISDRGAQFTSHFLEGFSKGFRYASET